MKTISYRTPEHTIIFILLAGFLLVDSIVGVIDIYMGVHIKVSLLYKTPVLFLVILIIATRDMKFFMWVSLALIVLLTGPIMQFTKYSDLEAIFYDTTIMLKIVSPLLYLRYFMIVVDEIPAYFKRSGPLILSINIFVLCANMLVGTFGFGYSSYSSGLGVNGFFSAGNELGAVFLILSTYILSLAFRHSLKRYILASVTVFLIGSLIATKASILASLLLISILPICYQGLQAFKPTPLKVVVTIALLIIGVAVATYSLETLKSLGLWTRIVWIYQEHGILRVILSNRDMFAAELLQMYSQQGTVTNWLFGMSSAAPLNHWYLVKSVAEIDPIDVLIMFGLIGLSCALLIQIWLFHQVSKWLKCDNTQLAPACLLCLILLECLAFTSGHIWLSGMVGPFLGLLFGLSYSEYREKNGYSSQ